MKKVISMAILVVVLISVFSGCSISATNEKDIFDDGYIKFKYDESDWSVSKTSEIEPGICQLPTT